MQGEARHIFGYVTYRVSEMMEGAGRFVDGVKAAGVEFFAGVPLMFPCGCHCTDSGVCPTNCINELGYDFGGDNDEISVCLS